jgi:CRISPR/Cas system CSM-associated protein Csm3 (group 7 of RAMP superfamily)
MTVYRVIIGLLVARTAVHIGAGEASDTTDALIRRDGTGQPLIPGTAIAGSLRALLTRLAPRLGSGICQALQGDSASCNCGVCHLFGDINPTDEGEAQASHLLVFDASLCSDIPTVIRDGVGIDRASSAAARAAAAKFDLEVLGAGAAFELRMELRGGNEQDECLLAAALAEWTEGRAWLGGRAVRGLGAFDLQDLRCVERDLDQADQLVAFLRSDEPWHGAQEVSDWLQTRLGQIEVSSVGAPAAARRWISVEFTLQAEGPLLTNDITASVVSGFDHAPLTATVGDAAQPVLPGAGLRGVLRSHAERIARTLATLSAGDESEFLPKCSACDPLARRSEQEPEPALESCDSLLKGQVQVGKETSADQLCLACRLFGSARRGSRLIVEDARFVGDRPVLKMLDFLAIDRFTGGGADGLKFDALALWKPTFRVRLHLDNPEPWELGWLALVLRDLREGWLNVGYGAAKGFGRVHIADDNWKLQLGFLGNDGLGLPATAISGVYQVAELNETTKASWLAQAQEWVRSFNEAVIGTGSVKPRWNELPIPKDTYFGQPVERLYPKEVNR